MGGRGAPLGRRGLLSKERAQPVAGGCLPRALAALFLGYVGKDLFNVKAAAPVGGAVALLASGSTTHPALTPGRLGASLHPCPELVPV